jgi:hypothetical protein
MAVRLILAPCSLRSLRSGFVAPFLFFPTAPWLGLQPTFFVSGGVPLLYLGASALVDSLPAVPELSLFTELPLSVLDGLTRAILLCNFVPVMITAHASLAVSTSPYTLLLTAFVRPQLYIGFPTR